MKFRLIAAVLFAAGAVAVAQDPNPYVKAKVGDFATYKMTTKVAQITVDGVITQQVTAVDPNKQVTIAVSGKVGNPPQDIPGQTEYKIDLTKPFDPTQANGPPPPGTELQVEKVKDEKPRVEKVKVGGKEYDARVDTYKVKVKAGGMEFDARLRAWVAADLPVPMAKMELAADVADQRLEVLMDLQETGNKPVEKKEPEKKDPKEGKKS
jgi:hypothetical protein